MPSKIKPRSRRRKSAQTSITRVQIINAIAMQMDTLRNTAFIDRRWEHELYKREHDALRIAIKIVRAASRKTLRLCASVVKPL